MQYRLILSQPNMSWRMRDFVVVEKLGGN